MTAIVTPLGLVRTEEEHVNELAGSLGVVGSPTSRTDLVAEAIKRAILDGTLAPGSPLSEREVASQLGVSKTPVRDAFKLLRVTGLVDVSSYQRVTVRMVDRALIVELYQARALIEPAAIGLAVGARGPGRLDAARQSLEEGVRAGTVSDLASLSLANRRFHRALYLGCPNRFLREELDQLQDLTALSATVGWRRKQTSPVEAAEHERILAACEEGDAVRAETLAREHVTAAMGTLLAAVDPRADD